MIFYCPACWKEIREDDKKCQRCGADLTVLDQKSFDEKLIQALEHPVRKTARMAVWILGERKTVETVAPLIRLFDVTENPFLQREILDTLDKIGTEDALNFIMESLDHHVSIVRRRAWEIMNEKEKRKE
ncbi:MAG TPA: HEAT repeat domain-containing protein [Nitrospirota bacterium]|nr:HEAT repeat domain-containing protein [Nitrospirota bacterium]